MFVTGKASHSAPREKRIAMRVGYCLDFLDTLHDEESERLAKFCHTLQSKVREHTFHLTKASSEASNLEFTPWEPKDAGIMNTGGCCLVGIEIGLAFNGNIQRHRLRIPSKQLADDSFLVINAGQSRWRTAMLR